MPIATTVPVAHKSIEHVTPDAIAGVFISINFVDWVRRAPAAAAFMKMQALIAPCAYCASSHKLCCKPKLIEFGGQ